MEDHHRRKRLQNMKTHQNPSSPQGGFTLIELMVTVAIVGILAAIAYPSYTESVRKGRRAEALKTLIDAEQFMRRFYSTRDTYSGATLPTSLTTSPGTGTSAYTVQFLESTTTTGDTPVTTTSVVTKTTKGTEFLIELKRISPGPMDGDRCGDLRVDQTGKRSLANETTGNTVSSCFPGS
jgi:type IV pilus assembly protein PilE